MQINKNKYISRMRHGDMLCWDFFKKLLRLHWTVTDRVSVNVRNARGGWAGIAPCCEKCHKNFELSYWQIEMNDMWEFKMLSVFSGFICRFHENITKNQYIKKFDQMQLY